MDYGPAARRCAGAGTIGGAIAANLSGPRRIKAGAARDHFLGFTAVSGRGETFKSGGRVVKNVTGYDLCKLMAGSWGTLAAMTEVTIKMLPQAETEETILVLGLDDGARGKAMAAAMGSYADVSAAAHLPRAVAAADRRDGERQSAVTAFRLEGVAPSVAQRKAVLESCWRRSARPARSARRRRGRCGALSATSTPFAANGPAGHATCGGSRRRRGAAPKSAARWRSKCDAELLYDWAGGLVWAALPAADDAQRGGGSRRGRRRRRPCHARSRAGRRARGGRRVRARAEPRLPH